MNRDDLNFLLAKAGPLVWRFFKLDCVLGVPISLRALVKGFVREEKEVERETVILMATVVKLLYASKKRTKMGVALSNMSRTWKPKSM